MRVVVATVVAIVVLASGGVALRPGAGQPLVRTAAYSVEPFTPACARS